MIVHLLAKQLCSCVVVLLLGIDTDLSRPIMEIENRVKVEELEADISIKENADDDAENFEDRAENFEDGAEKSESRKRKSSDEVSDDHRNNSVSDKRWKKIGMSLIRPSATLRFGADNVRVQARDRLCFLLNKYVRRQNWVEASGVLSVLLKGTCKDRSSVLNRFKYSAAMELLQQIEGDHLNPRRIKNIYDIWMKKLGSMKKQSVQERFAVHLEFILFCLTEGNLEEAHQAALSMMQENDFGEDPMSNFIIGLTFSRLWYSTIPKQFQLKGVDHPCSHEQSDMSESRFSNVTENLGGHDLSFHSQDADNLCQCESESSVMIEKRMPMDVDSHLEREDPAKVDANIQGVEPLSILRPNNFHLNSAENTGSEDPSLSAHDNMQYGSIFTANGLESWLLPIRLPHLNEESDEFFYMYQEMLNDYYKSAVKYLQLALNSTPPVSAALLPLVQLLLVGNHIGEALAEVENFCSISKAAFSFRVKASLLDCFDNRNHAKVSSSFEDVLKKDPTCSHSLARLVSMHQNGDYDAESLLEMIALHLDATFAEHSLWREFALCFLRVSHCEEDRLSVRLNENEDGRGERLSVCYNKIPRIFIKGSSGKNWKLRYRWWMRRHFSITILNSEILAGDFELMTYKAACASHIYGQDFKYVQKTRTNLEDNNKRELESILVTHMQNSSRLHTKFKD